MISGSILSTNELLFEQLRIYTDYIVGMFGIRWTQRTHHRFAQIADK